MTDRLVIALAQLNPTVGAVTANLAKARERLCRGQGGKGADLVLYPELFLSGYPPEDLVLRPSFVAACREAAEDLAHETADGPAILIGLPWRDGGKLYNAVALLNGRQDRDAALQIRSAELRRVRREARVRCRARRRGRSISRACASAFRSARTSGRRRPARRWPRPAPKSCSCPTARPSSRTRTTSRLNLVVARVTETGLPLAYLNQVGGQDELVFDGASFVLNADRSLALQMPMFEEAIAITEWQRGDGGWRMAPGEIAKLPERRGRNLARLRARPQGLCREEPLSRRGARPVGRHRFGGRRGDGGRCARRRARPLRDAALCLYEPRQPRRCRSLRRSARRALRRGADQGAGRRLPLGAQAAVQRAAIAM